MFTQVIDPLGFYSLYPMPRTFFETPSPYGNGAMLILNNYPNNSTSITPMHAAGIAIAVAQANAVTGQGEAVLEAYGVTDRTGSDAYNLALSAKRAKIVVETMRSALGSLDWKASWSAGLGERFAAEYYSEVDSTRDSRMRGVVCYIWDSISEARDPFLRTEIQFASPPGSDPARRGMLGPLHLGRYKSVPPSPFA